MDWYRTFSHRWIGRRGVVHEAVQLGSADTDAFCEIVHSMMHATGGMARHIDNPANLPAFAPPEPTHTPWDTEAVDPLEQPAPPAAQRPRLHRPRNIPRPYQTTFPTQQQYQPF
ncbi:hypothetical protein LINGRAHAP2_LOCUS32006 [Linum grandiflorum]